MPASAPSAAERQAIIRTLCGYLSTLGSANDVDDHGYADEAARMRDEACAAIRALMAEDVFLAELLPRLQTELDTGHILGFGWADLVDSAREQLNRLANPPQKTD